jgi:hypothetical protein
MPKSEMDVKGSNLCRNYAGKFASIVPRRLRDFQKHISKVQRFLRTLVDKGRKGSFLDGENAFKVQGANLFRPVHILISRNIF